MRLSNFFLTALGVCFITLGVFCSSDQVATGGGTDFPNTRTVAGVIVSSSSLAVDSARVMLIRNITGPRDPVPRFLFDTVRAGKDGAFAFEGVAAGRYAIEALSRDGAHIVYDIVEASSEEKVLVDTLRLQKAGSLRGTVIMRPGLSVILEISSTHYMVEPDSSGRFLFPLLPQGDWELNIIILDSTRSRRELDTTLASQSITDSTVIADDIQLPKVYTSKFIRRMFLNTTEYGAGISADLHAFPIAVRLDSARIDFTTTAIDGRDVRFIKPNGEVLPHQVEWWDPASKSALIWVLVDTVWADSAQPLFMIWGDTAAASTSAVFDTARGFRGVYHLCEESPGTGALGVFRDASLLGAQGNDNVSATGKDGVLARGQQFDGTDDYIEILPAIRLSGEFTLSLWVKPDEVPVNNTSYRLMGTYKDPWDTLYGFTFHTFNNDFSFAAATGSTPNTAGSWDRFVASWTHVALTFVPGTGAVEVYVDGEKATSDGYAGPNLTYINGVRTLISDPWSPFKGHLDEVRFESVRRPAQWIKLCYENQKPRQTFVEFR